jgi:hypothetical protein
MSGKEAAPNRCAVNDCRLPRQPGQYLCIEHKPKPPSLRESIASGPRFTAYAPNDCVCASCQETDGVLDHATNLCRPCWRAWRFSTGAKS